VNKKEAKKTLTNWDRAVENARVPDSKKFFASFFKKEGLPYLAELTD